MPGIGSLRPLSSSSDPLHDGRGGFASIVLFQFQRCDRTPAQSSGRLSVLMTSDAAGPSPLGIGQDPSHTW